VLPPQIHEQDGRDRPHPRLKRTFTHFVPGREGCVSEAKRSCGMACLRWISAEPQMVSGLLARPYVRYPSLRTLTPLQGGALVAGRSAKFGCTECWATFGVSSTRGVQLAGSAAFTRLVSPERDAIRSVGPPTALQGIVTDAALIRRRQQGLR
jgi:hypothetical protein